MDNDMRANLRGLAFFAACLSITGCSAYPHPIVDMQGVDEIIYAADLEECESYAEPIRVEVGATKGAVGGAVIGAETGAISGNAAEGAGYGSIWGAVRYGEEADWDKQMVVKRCLAGRGYRVLN